MNDHPYLHKISASLRFGADIESRYPQYISSVTFSLISRCLMNLVLWSMLNRCDPICPSLFVLKSDRAITMLLGPSIYRGERGLLN